MVWNHLEVFQLDFSRRMLLWSISLGFQTTEKSKVVLGNMHKFLCWESGAGVVMLIRQTDRVSGMIF